MLLQNQKKKNIRNIKKNMNVQQETGMKIKHKNTVIFAITWVIWNIDFGNKEGTLGCIVKRKVNNDYNYYILSAGHVFGNVFNTSPFPTGHRIVHPALLDKKYNKEKVI